MGGRMGELGRVYSIRVSIILLLSFWQLVSFAAKERAVTQVRFHSSDKYLIVELLDDNLAHFELSAKLPGPADGLKIVTSPMIARTDYPGPSHFEKLGKLKNRLETNAMRIDVDTSSLCVTLLDKKKNVKLTQLCPLNLDQYWKGFTLTRGPAKNLYGLGQEFHDAGVQDGDWLGKVRRYGAIHGNAMIPFNGGDSGNTQIPMLYSLGDGTLNYGLFLDQVYQQQWDFTSDPGKAEMYGDQIRWYFMTGDSLPELRTSYMELVGKPLVPPKKMFGLWISQYGFKNWDEMDSKLTSLRLNHFPVDGFVFDLYWFGGIKTNSDDSSMGKLSWDLNSFPDPAGKIKSLRENEGVGVMTIEESYISKNLPEHQALESKGYLVKDNTGKAAYLTEKGWWGRGGMIDWTNEGVWDYWHQWKRIPLIHQGVLGHWLDLGEPEIYANKGVYAGGLEPDVHNLYNLKWIQSIYQGYQHFSPERRPFLMSRSGAAGIQRYGAAMWSGDIGSNLPNLAAHQHSQLHMSLSGIDYYGADIGGFHREALGSGDLDEMYTQWFAYGMLFDIPGRPHTENLCQCKETAPDRIGDLDSNVENLRLRYRLIPYVYSLAHRANLFGEPVFPPLVYYFQSDTKVRTMGREKMIGASLLASVIAQSGQKTVDFNLPEGNWINFHTDDWLHSHGLTLASVPLYPDQKFTIPLYARAGAIIPMSYVDEKTMNALGQRMDGTSKDEMWVRVYSDATPSHFTLYEDDGATTQYLTGQVRRTELKQALADGVATITVAAAEGEFEGSRSTRNNTIELISENVGTSLVSLDGQALFQFSTLESWQAAPSGWFTSSAHHVLVKTGVLPVSEPKVITVR